MITETCLEYLNTGLERHQLAYYMTDDEKKNGRVDLTSRLRDFDDDDVRFVLITHKIRNIPSLLHIFAANVGDPDISSHVYGFASRKEENAFRSSAFEKHYAGCDDETKRTAAYMRALPEEGLPISESGTNDPVWIAFKQRVTAEFNRAKRKKRERDRRRRRR